MNKSKILSILLTTGILSGGLGMVTNNINIPTNTVRTHSQNIKLLSQYHNASYGCVINGNSNLVLKNINGEITNYISVGQMLKLGNKKGDKTFVTVEETGASGYISNSNIKYITSGVHDSLEPLNTIGHIINVTTNVNIRKSPTMSSSILSTLTNLTNVKILGQQGQWFKVQVNGFNGYIFDEYVIKETSNADILNNNSSVLNNNTTNIKPINSNNNNNSNSNNSNNNIIANSNANRSIIQTHKKSNSSQNVTIKKNKINNKILTNTHSTISHDNTIQKQTSTNPGSIPKTQKEQKVQNKKCIGQAITNSQVLLAPFAYDGLPIPKKLVGGKVVNEVPKGATVNVLKIDGTFLYVNYNGEKGWISYQSINGLLNGKTEIINTKKVIGHITIGTTFLAPGFGSPLCSAPTMNSKYLTTIPDEYLNLTVPVYAINGNWYEINYKGTIGWLNTNHYPCGKFVPLHEAKMK